MRRLAGFVYKPCLYRIPSSSFMVASRFCSPRRRKRSGHFKSGAECVTKAVGQRSWWHISKSYLHFAYQYCLILAAVFHRHYLFRQALVLLQQGLHFGHVRSWKTLFLLMKTSSGFIACHRIFEFIAKKSETPVPRKPLVFVLIKYWKYSLCFTVSIRGLRRSAEGFGDVPFFGKFINRSGSSSRPVDDGCFCCAT